MIWHLIESGFKTGKHNMDFDLHLAKSCNDNEAYFRLYRWKPYCISLGANQSIHDINVNKSKEDKIDIVSRPTGGRAILHAEEITYSVIIPLNQNLSPKEIYNKISLSLIRGLVNYSPKLSDTELENLQPDFPALLKQPSGMMCFASTAKNEVKFEGKKLVGSAQRKLNKVVLQHGSILCGIFHRKLADYLNSDKTVVSGLESELISSTIEIETILKTKTDYAKLTRCLIDGFQNEWQIELKPNPDFEKSFSN
ncbi:biotin/lipoate A/B protein ligase family protein [Bacteroidota bacterium]